MVDSTKCQTIGPAAAEVGDFNVLHGEEKEKEVEQRSYHD